MSFNFSNSNPITKSLNNLSDAASVLSSGKRINTADDDPAALSINQLLLSEIATKTAAIEIENATAANSRITDADFATAATAMITKKITNQSAIAMQAQKNNITSTTNKLLS